MGMNASAALWYGVYGDIPGEALEELEEPADNPYGEKVIDGIHVHVIWAGDTRQGAGGTVVHSWWGDKTSVDLGRLDAVKAAVDKFLDEYAVPGYRDLYLTADFS